jgi:hypothetical protein
MNPPHHLLVLATKLTPSPRKLVYADTSHTTIRRTRISQTDGAITEGTDFLIGFDANKIVLLAIMRHRFSMP